MGTQVMFLFHTLSMKSLQSGGPGFTRMFTNGEARYTIVGIVSGSLNGFKCGGGLPDYYTYVGNQEILEWIWMETKPTGNESDTKNVEEVEVEENKEYDFVEGKPEEWEITCDTDDDCPHLWYCAEKVYLEAKLKTISL